MSDIAAPVQGLQAQASAAQGELAREAQQQEDFSPQGRVADLSWSTLSNLLASSVEALVGVDASERHKELVLWLMNLERRLPPYDV